MFERFGYVDVCKSTSLRLDALSSDIVGKLSSWVSYCCHCAVLDLKLLHLKQKWRICGWKVSKGSMYLELLKIYYFLLLIKHLHILI